MAERGGPYLNRGNFTANHIYRVYHVYSWRERFSPELRSRQLTKVKGAIGQIERGEDYGLRIPSGESSYARATTYLSSESYIAMVCNAFLERSQLQNDRGTLVCAARIAESLKANKG